MRNIPCYLATVITVAQIAAAKDCTVSKEFQLKHAQVLGGVLKDPGDVTVPGVKLKLISGAKTVHEVRADDHGAYDFGEVPAGKYRIRVQSTRNGFCAPNVKCESQGCTIEPMLTLNPKVFHPVTVH
jgi:SdrD B-like domain